MVIRRQQDVTDNSSRLEMAQRLRMLTARRHIRYATETICSTAISASASKNEREFTETVLVAVVNAAISEVVGYGSGCFLWDVEHVIFYDRRQRRRNLRYRPHDRDLSWNCRELRRCTKRC